MERANGYDLISAALTVDTPLDRRIHRPPARWLARVLAGSAVTPNQLTVLSVMPALLAAILFGSGELFRACAGVIFFYLWAVMDHADGELARLKGQSSEFGKKLDDACDVLSSNLMLIGIFSGILPFWNDRDQRLFQVLFFVSIGAHALIGALLLRGKRRVRKQAVLSGTATERFLSRQRFLDHFTGREPFYFLLGLMLWTLGWGGAFWYSALMTILIIGSAVLTVFSAAVYWGSKRI